MAGEHVYLHFVSPDGSEPTKFVDALVLHASTDPETLDVAFYNTKRPGTGILDKIDVRLGLKHKNHEDIEKGKELFYYTWPPVVSADAEPIGERQIQLGSEPTLTDEQVYEDLDFKMRNSGTYEGTPGANLAQIFSAFHRYSVELRSKIEGMRLVSRTEEQALDTALNYIGKSDQQAEVLTDEQVYAKLVQGFAEDKESLIPDGATFDQTVKAFTRYVTNLEQVIDSYKSDSPSPDAQGDGNSEPEAAPTPQAQDDAPAEEAPAPQSEPQPEIVFKEYSDGTVATGVAPLPEQSPVEA